MGYLNQIPITGSNLLIFKSFLCSIRGNPFAEWSDSDANNGNENPGDVQGSVGFVPSLVVLLGCGIGCSASLPASTMGAFSPIQFLSLYCSAADGGDRGSADGQCVLETGGNFAGGIQRKLVGRHPVLGMAAHSPGIASTCGGHCTTASHRWP